MSPLFNPPLIVAILIALSVHEFAHAWAAYRLGDPTAKYDGRLTLNPIAHIDPLGALLFLTVGFGWGKPVPVNPRYFKKPKRDSALVSLAGPVSNLILAFIAYALLQLVVQGIFAMSPSALMNAGAAEVNPALKLLIQFLSASIYLNLGLMAFNLLPIAPLDGSKILAAFIPLQYEDEYEQIMRYGPYILLFLLISERVTGMSILFTWINGIVEPIIRLMALPM